MKAHYREASGVREKLCPHCREWKARDETNYAPKKRYADHVALESWCRVCSRWNTARWSRRNPEAWRKHCEAMTARNRRVRAERKERFAAIEAMGAAVMQKVAEMVRTRKVGLRQAPAVALDLMTRNWQGKA